MKESQRHEIGVGLLVLVALALLAYMAVRVGAMQGLGDRIEVAAHFSDASGLAIGAPVKVAGVEVGRVTGLSIDGDQAQVGLSLDRAAGLRADVSAKIRARSVLGEKYIQLVPHSTEAPLLVGGELLTQTAIQTEIDELVTDIGLLVDSVDPEAMHEAFSGLAEALKQDPERLQRVLLAVETAAENLARASKDAGPLADDARETMAAVRDLSDQALPVVARADEVLTEIDVALEDLPVVVEELRSLLQEAEQAVEQGRQTLARVDQNSEDLGVVLDNLSEIDKWELRRLLREEGILIRLRDADVVEIQP